MRFGSSKLAPSKKSNEGESPKSRVSFGQGTAQFKIELKDFMLEDRLLVIGVLLMDPQIKAATFYGNSREKLSMTLYAEANIENVANKVEAVIQILGLKAKKAESLPFTSINTTEKIVELRSHIIDQINEKKKGKVNYEKAKKKFESRGMVKMDEDTFFDFDPSGKRILIPVYLARKGEKPNLNKRLYRAIQNFLKSADESKIFLGKYPKIKYILLKIQEAIHTWRQGKKANDPGEIVEISSGEKIVYCLYFPKFYPTQRVRAALKIVLAS